MNDELLEVGELGIIVYTRNKSNEHLVGKSVEITHVEIGQEDPLEYYAGIIPNGEKYAFYKDQLQRIPLCG